MNTTAYQKINKPEIIITNMYKLQLINMSCKPILLFCSSNIRKSSNMKKNSLVPMIITD
jgi:hypothetical protein